MYEVKNETTYYMVDRREGKTYLIGNFENLIRELACRIHYEKVVDVGWHDPREAAKNLYADWDFSGGDTYWGKERKLIFGLTQVWNSIKHEYVWDYAWHYIYVDVKWTRPYMIIDDGGRVIDFRQWEQLIRVCRARRTKYYHTIGEAKAGEKFYLGRYAHAYSIYRFRRGPVPYTGYKHRGWSNLHKGIHNTIRNANDIRPKARVDWDYWDHYRHSDSSWKTNTKCRYQWQKHLRG